jgi:deferrochelatase/peroxidase EfeB
MSPSRTGELIPRGVRKRAPLWIAKFVLSAATSPAKTPQKQQTDPVGCHIRRSNPRDALNDSVVDARLHRLVRRGSASYPMLPEGVLEDDGVDRGVVLAFVNADPSRQFEFVQSQWINDGDFISSGFEKDPIVGNNDGSGSYTYPAKPVRNHMVGLPAFVVTKGGEHVFLPGIRGLKFLASANW